MDMSVNIAGVEWKNPVTVASGTFGSGAEFADYVDINKLGAVTTKGVANVPSEIRLRVWLKFTEA
jgi:dihydroorotate dehydrogenase (NAD+) catalytic subunit